MRHYSEFEPERIVLECRRCAEMLVLIGREEDWRSEGRSIFQCECGEGLTIPANRVREEHDLEPLLRRLRIPNGDSR
jgi:hypothetical protein